MAFRSRSIRTARLDRGVYGEGGIGWQVNLEKNEPARKAFKQKEWNKFRIEARGQTIKTWLNGIPRPSIESTKFVPV